MLKRIIVILPLFICLHTTVMAQDVVGCNQMLDDAREAYNAGMVELVPELLLPCIESGLSGPNKAEAYKLVINAYLVDYLPDEAATMMATFLEENPNYQAQSADPEEFKQLLEVKKQEREVAAAAAIAAARARQIEEQEALRKAEEENKQDRRAQSTAILNTDKPRIGFVLGATGTKGVLTEPYSIAVPLQDEGAFSLSPGFLLGAKVDLPLSELVEIGLGLYYNRVNLAYSAVPFDFTSYKYHECQNRIQLPVSMAVYVNPSAQIRAYFRLGVVTDYLISASAYGSRTYNGTGTYLPDVELERMSITDTRSRMNMHGLLGAGVMIPLQRSFLFVELTYTAGLFQANVEENRYDSQDIVWLLYHVDSNFRISQLGLNFGLSWNLN